MSAKQQQTIEQIVAAAVAAALANNVPAKGASLKAESAKAETVKTFIDADAVKANAKALKALGLSQQAVWGDPSKGKGRSGSMQRIKLVGEGFEISADNLAVLVKGVNALVAAHKAGLVVVAE